MAALPAGSPNATPSIVWRMQDVPSGSDPRKRKHKRRPKQLDSKVTFADDGKLKVIRDG